MPIVDVEETVNYLEREAAKIKLVNQEYPNFKLKLDKNTGEFSYCSPKVKYSFNDIEVISNSYWLSIKLTRKLEVKFKDEIINFTVYNSLIDYSLGRIEHHTKEFHFWEKPFTCKDKVLKKKAQQVIDMAILKFVQSNPGFSLDKSQLSP